MSAKHTHIVQIMGDSPVNEGAPTHASNSPASALQHFGVTQADHVGDDELLLLRAERKAITAEMARLSNFIDTEMAALAADGHFRPGVMR